MPLALEVNGEELLSQAEALEDNLKYFREIGQPIIEKYSSDLDNKINEIKTYMNSVRKYNLSFDVPTIQKYFLELTSILYFTSEQLEKVGLLEDMSRIRYRDTYNNAYLTKQGNNEAGKKYSVAQLQAYSDQVALTDNLLNFIYSRCYKILKAKVDSGNEVSKSLSKILSSLMQEMQSSGYSSKRYT